MLMATTGQVWRCAGQGLPFRPAGGRLRAAPVARGWMRPVSSAMGMNSWGGAAALEVVPRRGAEVWRASVGLVFGSIVAVEGAAGAFISRRNLSGVKEAEVVAAFALGVVHGGVGDA